MIPTLREGGGGHFIAGGGEDRRSSKASAESERAKAAFLSNLRHALSTPLTQLLEPLEGLLRTKGGSLTSEERDALAVTHRNGLRLQEAINSLLDFLRPDVRTMQAAYERTHPSALPTDFVYGLLANTPTPIFLKDTGGRYLLVNPAFERSFRVSHEQIEGRTDKDVFAPEQAARFRANDLEVIFTAVPKVFEEEAFDDDGQHFSIVHKFPLHDARGHIHAVGGIATDITDRKRVEEALLASEERYRSVVDTATDAVVTTDEDGKILLANPATTNIFGYSTSELIGQWLTMLMPPSMRERQKAALATYLQTGQRSSNWQAVELVGLRKNGQEFPADVSFGAVRTRGPHLFTGFIRDVTERKRADLIIRRNAEELRLLIEGIPQLIWTAGPDGSVEYHNGRLLAYHGRTIEEMRGNGSAAIVHPDDRDRAANVWNSALAARQPFEIESRLLGVDGEYRWFLVRGLPLQGDDGGIVKWFGTCTDIDDATRLRQRLERERDYLREEVKGAHASGEIVGQGKAITKVLMQVDQVARTAATVLLLGETGTGKELLARAIHNRSPRKDRPMVALNCAALPATLIESELFGREKGAYTGALTRQVGRFELADGSTLLLDEVSELPLELQAKLLRVLQEGQFERLGSAKTVSANVRIIAATNRDLERLVREGRFREDLYYRLNVFPIRLPPLRERREDIPLLVWTFVKECGRALGKSIESIPHSTLETLKAYPWPGNIRELRNVIERAMLVCAGSTLSVELPSPSERVSPHTPLGDLTLEEAERRHILSMLEKTGWRVSGKHGAAAILGLNPSTLQSRMVKLGIVRPH